MGNLEEWMDEEKIIKFFNEYNFSPKSIQIIKNKRKNGLSNFCFVTFFDKYEANDALVKLDGKQIPNTNSTFKLKLANSNSESIDVYVGNLSEKIDNLELYNLFKEKYPSVHHTSIITRNNISEGYGFINFLEKEESEKCIKEMDGFIFYNKPLRVKGKINNYHKKNDNYGKKKSEEEKEEDKEEEEKEKEEICNDIITENYIEFFGILKGHYGPVTSLVCSEDENGSLLLFSGSEDTTIIKWELFVDDKKIEENKYIDQKEELLFGKPKKIIREHYNFITCLSLNTDKKKLASSSLDKTIIIRDTYTLNQELIIEDFKSGVTSVWFSYDNKLIFGAEKNKIIKFYNSHGDLRFTDKILKAYITCFLNSNNKKRNSFFVGLSDGKVRIYNNEYNIEEEIPLYDSIKYSYDKIETNNEEKYSVVSLAIDDDEDFLFVGYRNGIVAIFSLEENNLNYEKKIKKIIKNDRKEINSIIFKSKFFEYIFIADNKGFNIRKIVGGKKIFEDNSAACFSFCFDENRNNLFAGFGDGIIRVYHLKKDY